MKKLLALSLAMLMLLTTVPFTFAEVIANGDTPIAIAADAETKIELEDYATGEFTDIDGNVASCQITVHKNDANSYIFNGGSKGKNLTQTLKLNVAEAGTYDIELVYAEADYLSKTAVSLNGVTVPEFHTSQLIPDTTADDGSTVYYFEADFKAYKKYSVQTFLSGTTLWQSPSLKEPAT